MFSSISIRNFHTTGTFYIKPYKMLNKVMGVSKKKKYFSPQESPRISITSNFTGKSNFESKITGNSRRTNVLNKIFMRHITDIMATGEFSKDLSGYGIEVNKIKVSPDYKLLNVFWIGRETADMDVVEQILKKNAGFIRRELTYLRVIGNIPKIEFVKDRTYAGLLEVQEKLAIADYGEDFQPTDIGENYKSEFELLTSLDDSTKKKIEALNDGSSTIEDDDFSSQIPPMPHNVLGLDHARIMKNIKRGLAQSKAVHRSADTNAWMKWSEYKETQNEEQDSSSSASSELVLLNRQEQRKAFKNFLKQRQILRAKQYVDKTWSADKEYTIEELRERYQKSIDFEEFLDEEDFITEDFYEDLQENGK